MGAWSAAILGNDTSCEVYERFIELYNSSENTTDIAPIVLEEQEENLQYDRTNVWFGLALACWECKALTQQIILKVKAIIESNEDIEFCKELDADERFLKERKNNLDVFLKKISTEKEKPRIRKKPAKPVESNYKAGMCMSYKNDDENYIGVYITESGHFKNKGMIEFCFLAFESKKIPDIKMFKEGRLLGLKKSGKDWKQAEYCGNVTNVHYDKTEKEDFFHVIPTVFTILGNLPPADPDKLINNFRGGFMDLNKSESVIRAIEKIRLEWKSEHSLSDISLGELLDKVGLG